MADTNIIEARIGANVEGLRSGAAEANGHIDGLVDHLKEFKSHAVSTGRTARFFATDLAEIIPGADGAKGALKDLLAIGLSGSVLISAIEGVIVALKALNEAAREHDKYLNDIQGIYKTIGEDGKKAYEKIRETLEGPVSKAQEQWRKDVDKTHDSLADTRKEVEKYKDESHVFRDLATGLQALFGATSSGDRIIASTGDKIEELQHKATAAVAALASLVPERKKTQAAEDREERKKQRDQEALDDANWRASENREWKKHYDELTASTTKFLQDKFAAEDKEALDEAKLLADETKEYKKHYDQVLAETNRALQEQFDAEDRAAKKLEDERLRLQRHLEKIMVDGARNIASSFGGAFASMVTGAQSVDAAFASMAKSGIKAVIDMALKSIEAYVLSAQAAAAFSQAGIPVIGPVLAMAAAAAMGAFISGLADQLPSAAGGYDIPSGVNPIVQTHSREMILPESIAEPLRDSLEGGGGGGELHVHIHAMDGASVHRVVHSDAFVRAMRDARRVGRMP